MSEPKFTKGPWRVGKPFYQSTSKQNVTPILWDSPTCGECGKGDGEWLVAWTFPNSLKKPQFKFNAHLIAAAPDLYAALEALESAFMAHTKWNGEPPVEINNALAALAKANGEKA